MSNRRTATTDPRRATAPRRGRGNGQGNLLRWLLLAVPVVALAAAIATSVALDREGQFVDGARAAPGFTLPTTAGGTLSLDEVLADGDALLYFSMGIGCDPCFAQIPEIEDALTERGIELVSIKVQPAEALAREAARFGIERPLLVDEDRTVSEAYGMLGQFGHGSVPSHSFAYVSSEGTIEAVRHYPVMFVPLEQLLADLDL